MLSHPLCIIALVGHYPTNKLVQRSPLPRRNHTFDPKILSGITHSFPWLFRTSGYVTTRYSPFRRSQEPLTSKLSRTVRVEYPTRLKSNSLRLEVSSSLPLDLHA